MRNTLKISKITDNPKKEKELQSKLEALAIEYPDVSMLFMHNLNVMRVEEEGEPIFYFPEEGKKGAHHYIRNCVFTGDGVKAK